MIKSYTPLDINFITNSIRYKRLANRLLKYMNVIKIKIISNINTLGHQSCIINTIQNIKTKDQGKVFSMLHIQKINSLKVKAYNVPGDF